MSERIQASLNVWLQSDVERILRGLVQANTHLLSIHHDEYTVAFAAGYLAALQAVGESFGVETLRDRREAQR